MFKKIFIIFKVVVILNLLVCLINKDIAAIFICIFNFLLFFVADYLKQKLNYNDILQLFIYLFFTGSLLGGEVYQLYVKFLYFDIILHVFSSFILSFIAYYLISFFKANISSLFAVVFIFSFAMMVAAMWEITEFSIDRLFNADMQKDTIVTEIKSNLFSEDGSSVVKKEINSSKIGNCTFDGYIDIGLYDTIDDMVCAVFGSLLFIIIYKLKEAF